MPPKAAQRIDGHGEPVTGRPTTLTSEGPPVKNPPILISIIGFFAALAGFGFLFWGLRALGFDWFGLFGDLPAVEHVGLWGWLAIATGVVWVLAAVGLWALQPWARLFALFMAGFALFVAALASFPFPRARSGV